MQPSLNTWTIVFLIAAMQGLFLCVMIFLRRSRTNNLLAFLILAFSLCMLYYVAYWTGYFRLLPYYIASAQGFTYVLGPLAYFYLRSDRKTFYFNGWHFVPFCLFMTYFLAQPLFSTPYPSTFRLVQVVVQNLQLVVYTVIIFTWINGHKDLQNGALKLYVWRKKVAYAFAGYTLSFLLYYILVWTHTLKIEYDYLISVASSFFIYFIGYHGFQNPAVLKMQENGKYDKSSLSSSAASAILSKLKIHMAENKPYLDSALKLQHLAEQLSLSPHHISQVINDLLGQNFSDFINQHRIEEAIRELSEEKYANKKVIHIALDCGFNNKTSFNTAFKKVTGTSPSVFRNQQLKIKTTSSTQSFARSYQS